MVILFNDWEMLLSSVLQNETDAFYLLIHWLLMTCSRV